MNNEEKKTYEENLVNLQEDIQKDAEEVKQVCIYQKEKRIAEKESFRNFFMFPEAFSHLFFFFTFAFSIIIACANSVASSWITTTGTV